MLQNLFRIAIRNLNKSRFYTFINIFGLTTGITACLVILLFVRFELSYDTFNENADRIVRVDWELLFGENSAYNAAVTPPMAEVLVRDYPEVEAAARLRYSGAFQFRKDVENIVEWQVVYADNDFFKVFTMPFISGNPANALKDPGSMVISEKCAQKFFPNEDALGKILVKDNSTSYKITGIVKDIPDNSHFHYRIFLSMEGLDESKNGNWIGGPYNTYLLLREGTDARQLEAKLPVMVEKYLVPQAATMLGSAFMEDFRKGGNRLTLHLRPLLNIHLHSHLRNELEGNSDVAYVYLLSAIATFILIIACINFMNLATARSVKRAHEVGIRKVLGSSRKALALQFLTESTILSIFSFVMALMFANLALPMFNMITGLHLTIPTDSPALIAGLCAAAIGVGIVAGIYPGIVLASYQPMEVLNGKRTPGHSSSFLRSGLVVFQFTVSIFLISATMALYQQMNFIRNQNLGFKKEQVIVLKDVKNAGEKLLAFRDEILRNRFIQSATISSFFPGPGSARNTPLMWRFDTSPTPDNSLNLEKWTADYDYAPTLGLEFVTGRNFSRDFPSDSSAVILNESAVRKLGLPKNPIGHRLSLFHENADGSQDRSKLETWTLVGVVKDFNFESLRERVEPLGLFFGTNSRGSIAIRYESTNTQAVIADLERKWKALAPGEPFNYSFLDENFQRMYVAEEKLGEIFITFSGLAIIIACLGLFALTAFTAEQRTKEIGVRKVLGATSQNIVLLLSREFSKLILLGFVFAAPLAAYGVDWYLQQYAYRTHVSLWIYAEAGLLAFLLAFLTMGYQSIKAAHTNPVDALRTE